MPRSYKCLRPHCCGQADPSFALLFRSVLVRHPARTHTQKKSRRSRSSVFGVYIYIHGHAARIGFGPKRRDDGGGDCWSQEEILGKVVKI